MSKEDFYAICSRFMSPYVSETLASLYALIDDNELAEIETDLKGLLSLQDTIDPLGFPSLLIELVTSRAVNILRSEGVIFCNDYDGGDVDFIHTLLSTHLSISKLEDDGWIRELIDHVDTDDGRDIYYEIITGLCELGTESYYEYIDSVSMSLIEAIRNNTTPDDDEMIEPTVAVIYDATFIDIYKHTPEINKFINAYYDIGTTYSLESVISEDYYRNVVVVDNQFDSSVVVLSTYLLCKDKIDVTNGVLTFSDSDKNDIIRIASIYASANNIPITDVMSRLSTYYKTIDVNKLGE